MYVKDVFRLYLHKNQFEKLTAKIRGGAVMVKQDNATYFGKRLGYVYPYVRYVFEENVFTGCSAQQGGAMYLDNVRNLSINGTNEFKQNVALQYNSIQTYSEQGKAPEEITTLTKVGKGPGIFTECNQTNQCSIYVYESTKFESNTIFDVPSQ